jgi:hypothetical protein
VLAAAICSLESVFAELQAASARMPEPLQVGEASGLQNVLHSGVFVPDGLLARWLISDGAKVLWARLARYAGTRGQCFPLLSTLTTDLGFPERQVQRHFVGLVFWQLPPGTPMRIENRSGEAPRRILVIHSGARQPHPVGIVAQDTKICRQLNRELSSSLNFTLLGSARAVLRAPILPARRPAVQSMTVADSLRSPAPRPGQTFFIHNQFPEQYQPLN